MNAIQDKAGYIALCCYWGIVSILTVFMLTFEDNEVLHDPYVVLIVPWFFSTIVFLAILLEKGFMRTIREEANRSPQETRKTKLWQLLGILVFAVTIFLLKRFDILDNDANTIQTDLLESCWITAFVGVYLWFTEVRKVRGQDD